MVIANSLDKQYELYSFDIFDTLITRRVANPLGIFTIVQELLINDSKINNFVSNNFYQIRIGAEEFARHKAFRLFKQREITINDIYNIIQNNYNLSDNETDYIKQLEIRTEINNLVPINKNLSILKDLKSKYKKVILISDMYYGADYLRKILIHIDPIFNDIKIYSSADYKVSKSDGELYSIVQKEEDVAYSNWQHYGDNKHSDIKKAKSFGIKTIYTPQIELNRYEEKLLKQNENNKFYQAIIGSAKLARLFRPLKNSDKYDFGASFAAPILYNYVDWILSQSIEKGFETLYFVARDEYTPKIVADIIIKKRNLPITTKYLYGSRLAWREFTNENFDNFVDYTFDEYNDKLTSKFLAYRLGMKAEEIASMLNLPSISTKIKHRDAKKYATMCKKNSEIKNKLLNANKDRVNILKKYLIQEIDFTKNNIAFVDLHGTGRTQDCIASILNQIKPCKLYCFYLTNSLLNQTENSIKLSYFSSSKYMSHWVELLCRNTDGQTVGYRENNGIIEAVTEKDNGKEMIKWGFNEYLEAIKNYTNFMITIEDINKINFNVLDLYCKYFDYLTKDLDKKTAVMLGDIPYLSIGKEDNNIVKASKKIHSWKILLNFILCRKHEIQGQFPYISSARSSSLSKFLQKILQDCPTIQKFLLNVYIHKKERKAYIRLLGIKISFGGLLWKK